MRDRRSAVAAPRSPSDAGGTNAKHGRLTLFLIFAIPLAVAGLIIGTSLTRGPSGDTANTGTSPMSHIHSLALNPIDDALYAGTHDGLFQLSGARFERVGTSAQDFMGFTIGSPTLFLASGHPEDGIGGPGSVGLIRSEDGGRSWSSMSLDGEADFHALSYAGGRVWGLDAATGQLMVSDDMRKWEVRSTTPAADLEVSPEDDDTLLLTTPHGVALSRDGGRNFELLAQAPRAPLVSWAPGGDLAAVSSDGRVYTARRPTGIWMEQGTVSGSPEAVLLTSSELYVAAGGEVWLSRDGGRNFDPVAPAGTG